MPDPTEPLRRAMVNAISGDPKTREELEQVVGQVWDTDQLRQEFTVKSFLAPYVLVQRKDGAKGTMMFQHMPRYYFGFQQED